MSEVAFQPGSIVGQRYRLRVPLGTGRLGRTWLALDEVQGTTVALRPLTPRGPLNERRLAELSAVMTGLIETDHDGVMIPLDLATTREGHTYVVWPYANSGSLADDANRFPALPLTLRWGAELLDALAHCHERGLVHGDIKPSNVLLSVAQDGAVRTQLADFGLARALGAPHVAAALARAAGPNGSDELRTLAGFDVVAVAGLLYEMLTGHAPIDWNARATPRKVADLVPRADLTVPSRVVSLVMDALTKPASAPEAAALRDRLTRLESRPRRPRTRNRLAVNKVPSVVAEELEATGSPVDVILGALTRDVVLRRLIDSIGLLEGVESVSVIERPLSGQSAVLAHVGHSPDLPGDAQLEGLCADSRDLRGRVLIEEDGTWTAALPVREDRSMQVLIMGECQEKVRLAALDLAGTYARAALSRLSQIAGRSALKHEAELRAALLELSRDGTAIVSRSGLIRALNEPAAKLMGVPGEGAIGRRLREYDALGDLDALVRRTTVVEDEALALPGGRVRVRSRPLGEAIVVVIEPLSAPARAELQIPSARGTFGTIIGTDSRLVAAIETAKQAALSDASLLIGGESGTGKRLLAEAIHNASERASGPFVVVRVASVHPQRLEAELFGRQDEGKGLPGRLELAHGGTLLIEDIGLMPSPLQAQLHATLESGASRRVGGTKVYELDLRVVATTNANLETIVDDGALLEELFYLVGVVRLTLPPLRERKEDIRRLLEGLLDRFTAEQNRPELNLGREVLADLQRYDWPGNVRELVNMVEGWVSVLPPTCREIERTPAHVRRALGQRRPSDVGPPPPVIPVPALAATNGPLMNWKDVERQIFQRALSRYQGNLEQAADALGIARGAFYNKARRHGLITGDSSRSS